MNDFPLVLKCKISLYVDKFYPLLLISKSWNKINNNEYFWKEILNRDFPDAPLIRNSYNFKDWYKIIVTETGYVKTDGKYLKYIRQIQPIIYTFTFNGHRSGYVAYLDIYYDLYIMNWKDSSFEPRKVSSNVSSIVETSDNIIIYMNEGYKQANTLSRRISKIEMAHPIIQLKSKKYDNCHVCYCYVLTVTGNIYCIDDKWVHKKFLDSNIISFDVTWYEYGSAFATINKDKLLTFNYQEDSEYVGIETYQLKITTNVDQVVIMTDDNPINNIVYLKENNVYHYKNEKHKLIIQNVKKIVKLHKKVGIITKNNVLFLYTPKKKLEKIDDNVSDIKDSGDITLYLRRY